MGACGSTVRGPVLDQEDKRELLMAITINRDFDRIKSTIDRYPGIDLNRIDLDGMGCNPLHLACRYGCIDVVEFLLSFYQMDVNRCNNAHGSTPLTEVVRNHYTFEGVDSRLMKLLISYGCDINLRGRTHSLNPLHWAVVLNYEEGVKILLETGKADLNMDEHTSQSKITPIDRALLDGNQRLVSLLQSAADFQKQCEDVGRRN